MINIVLGVLHVLSQLILLVSYVKTICIHVETKVQKYSVTCPSSHIGKMSQDMNVDSHLEHVFSSTSVQLKGTWE